MMHHNRKSHKREIVRNIANNLRHLRLVDLSQSSCLIFNRFNICDLLVSACFVSFLVEENKSNQNLPTINDSYHFSVVYRYEINLRTAHCVADESKEAGGARPESSRRENA